MKSFKKIFGDLPVTLKVVLLAFFIVLIYFIKEASYMYVTMKTNVESLVGSRMEFVARTAALVINGDSHQQVVKAYLDRDPDLTKRDDFKKIQRILRRIQKINELGSDIYTLVQPQWKENSLVFITMSNPKTYVGNSIPVNPSALECLRTGRPTRTALYKDRKGTWISAYAPIRNKKRSVIAMVAVDYKVDNELREAAQRVAEWAGVPSLALLFFFLILAAMVGRSIASPLDEMTDAVVSVADGVPGGNIFTVRRDEIGRLAQAVNSMLESSTRNSLDSKGELSTLRDEREQLAKNLHSKELELKRTIQAYQALLGKLDEGCLIFLKDGKVLPQYSKICEDYL
ncbi:MAG: HAMP domain-containing protein, partial [Bdellovibrionales bacterium]|nr:HAMP domain-containing protein [Bdellovibrionales bacterium]